MKRSIFVWSCLISLSGCALFDSDGTHPTKFTSSDIFEKPIDRIDILSYLTKGDKNAEKNKKDYSLQLEMALENFTKTDVMERNKVQDRIILASNASCEKYKSILKERQSKANFWLGTAATTFGAAGAVVTGAEAGRTLAALSGTSSGVRAEYNQSYFSDLAAQVITKGITARRAQILETIDSARAKTLTEYTVEMAIADAITYHGSCSLIGGLEQADAAIVKTSSKNPGIDALGANSFFNRNSSTSSSSVSSSSSSSASSK